jgi:DNA-binding MarR family transcriptional regulator
VGESFASPRHDSSEREIERILSSLMQREERERVYERLIDRSGIEITPPEGWLLRRIAERSPTSESSLSDQLHTPPERLHDSLASLTRRAYIRIDSDQKIELTPAGQAASDQLIAAGREQLCGLLEGWEPEHDEDLQPVLRRLAGALVVEMPGR